jgi:hypothetical protein
MGLARLAEGFNPPLKIGKVIYPLLLIRPSDQSKLQSALNVSEAHATLYEPCLEVRSVLAKQALDSLRISLQSKLWTPFLVTCHLPPVDFTGSRHSHGV